MEVLNNFLWQASTGFSAAEVQFLSTAQNSSSPERSALLQAMSTVLSTSSSDGSGGVRKTDSSDTNCLGDGGDAGGPVDIPLARVLLSMLPLPLIAALSIYLHLGLHKKLAVATIRCAAQLSVLGYVLLPIFVANRWWLTSLYTICMLLIAGAEAVSRPSHAYSGMLLEVLLAMGVAGAAAITFGLAAVVQVYPWYDAQYLIPMLGMLLGNACSSVAVGLSSVLEELSSGRDKVEALLALGATRIEATREVVQRAARLALTPLLNSMNVVGIVSIPGMMTGQILGGSDPAVASRYQIVIYYLVAMSSSVSAIATIYAAVLTICDGKHRLRASKLQTRGSRARGAMSWMKFQLVQGWNVAGAGIKLAAGRMSRAWRSYPAPRERHRYFAYRIAGGSNGGGGGNEDVAAARGRDDDARPDVEQPLLQSTP